MNEAERLRLVLQGGACLICDLNRRIQAAAPDPDAADMVEDFASQFNMASPTYAMVEHGGQMVVAPRNGVRV